jgi:hypothetical protein
MDIRNKPQVIEWLDECRKSSTRRIYGNNITKFFEWHQGSYEEFLKLDSKATRHVLLKYQNEHSGVPANTVNNVITAMCSFLIYLDKPVNLRGKRLSSTPDLDSHVFTNGDLTKMFDLANTKEKALLALGTSLGWEISAVLEFDRKTLENLVKRARSEGKDYIYFRSQRKKTGAARYGVLNPLALEWCEKWLKELPSKKVRTRKENKQTKDRPISEVFDIGEEGANLILKRLAREAGLVLTGRVHFHKIRGWVMSGLSRAGFNEFQLKYVVGKAIPLRDMTYLQTLEQEIEERYPKAFEQFLNIKPAKVVTVVDQNLIQQVHSRDAEIQELKAKIAAKDLEQEQRMKDLQDKLESVDQKIDSKIVQELRKFGLVTKIGKNGKPILDQQRE